VLISTATFSHVLKLRTARLCIMVLYESRPDGICPDRKNDLTVKLSQGDLMSCASCEAFRFPETAKAKATVVSAKASGDSKSRLQSSTPVANDMMIQTDKLIQCELHVLFFVIETTLCQRHKKH